MTSIARRLTAVVGRAANSGAVAPGVAALCTIAGIGLGNPAAGAAVGIPAGALVGAAAEELVDVAGRLWSYRRARVERFAATVVDETGVPLEDLLQRAAENPRAMELLAQAVEAASQAVDEWKIDVLASVWVNSIKDDATVEAGQLLVDALRQLEVPHLRLLRVLDSVRTIQGHARPSARSRDRLAHPRSDIARWEPGLAGALDALAAKLVSLGMAVWEDLHYSERGPDSAYGNAEGLAVTAFGSQCAAYLVRRSEHAEASTE